MPLYDYYCEKCGNELKDELVRSHDTSKTCVICGEIMKKGLGSVQFKFKNSSLQKHLKKYGNSNEAGVPKGKDNGVRIDVKRRDK